MRVAKRYQDCGIDFVNDVPSDSNNCTGSEYNDADKLVRITYPGSGYEEFLYDGNGVRREHHPKGASNWVKFTDWGSTIDGNLNPAEEDFSYHGNELVEILRHPATGSDSRFNVFNDYLGSVRQIVTSDTYPADDSRFDYTAFGLKDTEKDYSGLGFNAKSPSKFVGAQGYYDGSGRGSDQESDGLVLCGQRFYDPQTGRWLTEDPIGFDGGRNMYVYCDNCPTAGVDPGGRANHGFPGNGIVVNDSAYPIVVHHDPDKQGNTNTTVPPGKTSWDVGVVDADNVWVNQPPDVIADPNKNPPPWDDRIPGGSIGPRTWVVEDHWWWPGDPYLLGLPPGAPGCVQVPGGSLPDTQVVVQDPYPPGRKGDAEAMVDRTAAALRAGVNVYVRTMYPGLP